MAEHLALDAQIAEARARLESNLTELRDRARRAREIVSPSTYLENTWLMIGVGVVVGYCLSRALRRRDR